MSQRYENTRKMKPDHGENFVPGSEAAPENLAPQPLDHFKRGYRERAEQRDRETNQLANDNEFRGQESFEEVPPPPQQRFIEPEPSSRYRGTGGFDPVGVVDTLCRPGCNLIEALDRAKEEHFASFASGKALTAILSNLARRRKMGIALSVWQWMDHRGIDKNVYHYNSLISVCEKTKDHHRALQLLHEMEDRRIGKNEVTFSSAISACEKAGQWRMALDLLDRMKIEGVGRTAIAYNAAISACEKGLVPHKALELFDQMKREGVTPTVITYSALISAAEKGQQWKLALEVLEEMKASGHGANVIAYSAAISALSKGQMWEKALELFREIESSGNTPSIVTYNATMTALEKGLQWERALDLFDEMKMKRLPITVVSYGSAISACEKGLQYRQCLEYLDEMTELGIKKNVIIFGAAMSCMEKCCRADIAFQLMDRMKMEGVAPNVHIYNSAISACARSNLWEKGLELFEEMDKAGVVKDVVSYNAVLDAVSSQVALGRRLFQEGVERGFYARVSRLGTQWLELDLHFLSLGGGEIALGWWFEECLVPYLVNTSKLAAVKSIDIVTGYGKTRMRGVRHGDDGMRKRVRAMLSFMGISEVEQPNKGRIHIDKEALMKLVEKNAGKITFDEEGYNEYKEENTTANHIPTVEQTVRPRYSAEHFRDVPLGDAARPTRSRDFRSRNRQDSMGFINDRSSDIRRRGSDVRRRRSSDFNTSFYSGSGGRGRGRRESYGGDGYGNSSERRGSYTRSRDERPYDPRHSQGRNAFDNDRSYYGNQSNQCNNGSQENSRRFSESSLSHVDGRRYSHSSQGSWQHRSDSVLQGSDNHYQNQSSDGMHASNAGRSFSNQDVSYQNRSSSGHIRIEPTGNGERRNSYYGNGYHVDETHCGRNENGNHIHGSDRFQPARRQDSGDRSWGRPESGEFRRDRSRSRERDEEGTDLSYYGRQQSLEPMDFTKTSNDGPPSNGNQVSNIDRPQPKRRGYDLQQSRSSFTTKRSF